MKLSDSTFLNKLKSLSRDSLIYGAASAFSKLVSLITAPILTRIFVPSDYGVIALMQVAVGAFVMLAGMNLNSGAFFYYHNYEAKRDKSTVVSTTLYVYLLCSLVFSCLLWYLAPELDVLLKMGTEKEQYDYASYLKIMAVGMFFALMDVSFQSFLRMTRKAYRFFLVNIAFVLSNLILIIYLVVYLRMGIEGAIWSGVLSSVLASMIGFCFCVKHYRIVFSGGMLALVLAYSLPQLPGVVINWGLMQSNRFFLNYYSSLAEQGLYSIAMLASASILIVITAFRMAYDPYALSIMKEKGAPYFYTNVFKLYMLFFGIVGALVSIWAKPILQILTPDSYHAAYIYVPVMVLGYVILGANNILATGIWLSKKTGYTSVAQVFAFVVNIALNFLLIPKYQAMGAAVALLGGVLTQSVAYYKFSQALHPMPYEFTRLILSTLTLYLIVILHTTFIVEYTFMQSSLASIFSSMGVIIVFFTLALSRSEKRKTLEYLKSILNRRKELSNLD